MAPKTYRSPTDPPDYISSPPDNPNETDPHDGKKPARNSKENGTTQDDQTDNLSPTTTLQNVTNLTPNQPSTHATQPHKPTKRQSPSKPRRVTLGRMILLLLLTARLERLLASLQTLLYNDPKRLQKFLDDPPQSLAASGREILLGKRHKRPQSSDRQGRAHAPIAHRRRRRSSSSCGSARSGGRGAEQLAAERGDGNSGGVAEEVAAARGGNDQDFEAEGLVVDDEAVFFFFLWIVAMVVWMIWCCWLWGWYLKR